AEAAQVDGLAAVAPHEAPALQRSEAGHRIPSSSSSPTGSKNEHEPIELQSVVRVCAQRAAAASRSPQRNERTPSSNEPHGARSASSSPRKTAAASRFRKPCSPFAVGYA